MGAVDRIDPIEGDTMPWHIAALQLINGLALGSVYALTLDTPWSTALSANQLRPWRHLYAGCIFRLLRYHYAEAFGTSHAGFHGSGSSCGSTTGANSIQTLRSSSRIAVLITAIGASLFSRAQHNWSLGPPLSPFPKPCPFDVFSLAQCLSPTASCSSLA